MMKNPPGPYINHMLESDGVKRRALRARRLERPPINEELPISRTFSVSLFVLKALQNNAN